MRTRGNRKKDVGERKKERKKERAGDKRMYVYADEYLRCFVYILYGMNYN